VLAAQYENLARTGAGRRAAEDVRRWVQIVAGDQFGSERRIDLQQSTQRHQLPLLIGNVQIGNIVQASPEPGIGLDPHLEALVELVEQVDKG
jgi:hypothetical protein